MNPLVSIIIPVFNRLNFLKATFESVYSQTYDRWEIIGVDDGSDDGSYEWLLSEASKSPKIRVLKNNKGVKGPSAARNSGAAMANGDYLIFLDSDDLLLPNCIGQRIKVMQENSNLDFAVFEQLYFKSHPQTVDGIFTQKPLSGDSYLAMFARVDNPWQTMAVIWRKEYFCKLGGFDESFLVMEDPLIHLIALLKNGGYKICYDLPADSLYRIAHMDGQKEMNFYANSIKYRIKFFKRVYDLCMLENFKESYENIVVYNLRRGIVVFIRDFLLSRINSFKSEANNFIEWISSTRIFNKAELKIIKWCIKIWSVESPLITKFHIKGFLNLLVFNFIFPENNYEFKRKI